MSERISDQKLMDEMRHYIDDVDANYLVHMARRVADAQRDASDREWVKRLDKLGYAHIVNDMAIYARLGSPVCQ